MKTETKKLKGHGVLEGVIVSTKMAKTVVVEVSRFVRHPRYGKFLRRSKRYLAHHEGEPLALGARVRIKSDRPRSRNKHFIVI